MTAVPGEGISAAGLKVENILFHSRVVRCCNHILQTIDLNVKKL